MAEITPKIVDGIKYWNIIDDKKFTYTDINGKVWKGKQAFNRKFEEVLSNAYQKALTAKKQLEGSDAKLSSREVSNLRRHEDVGMWLIDGKPASVNRVNKFLTGSGRKKVTSLSLNVPKSTNKYFTREFIESAEFRDEQIKKWTKRLDEFGWPEGASKKGFITYLQNSYNQIDEYNKILSKRLGFPFQAGHIWGAMGPKGDRTTIGPLGAFSGGKFTLRNVTSQPSAPHINQLLDKAWNIITPNVPGFYDARGVQIESAKDLLEAGFGGQGFPGALADYLTQGGEDLDKLDVWDRAYIAFGDPSRGDFIGKTVEARKAQILTPGFKDDILRQAADLAATAEKQSGPLRIIQKGKDALENTRALQIAGDIAKSTSKVPGFRSLVPGTALALNALNIQSKAAEAKQNPTIGRRIQHGAAIAEGALEGIEIGTAGLATPVTTPLQIGLGLLDAGIEYGRTGRQRGDAKMGLIGEIPGTKSYNRYVQHGITLQNTPAPIQNIQINKKEEEDDLAQLTIGN